MKRKELQTKV